jgi:hypothetical protein
MPINYNYNLNMNMTTQHDNTTQAALAIIAASPAPATERPGDHAAALAEDWGCSYSDALVYCNCD